MTPLKLGALTFRPAQLRQKTLVLTKPGDSRTPPVWAPRSRRNRRLNGRVLARNQWHARQLPVVGLQRERVVEQRQAEMLLPARTEHCCNSSEQSRLEGSIV